MAEELSRPPRRSWLVRHWILALAVVVAALPMGMVGFVYSGIYNVAATADHLTPTYWLMHTTMTWSVRQRARSIEAPPLDDPAKIRTGAALYRDHCLQCHGAPGEPPRPFALGLTPTPVNLAETAKNWRAREVYWAVRHGIKMTAMPAWEYRLRDDELWAVVAFVMQLPKLSPRDYQAIASAAGPSATR